MTLKISELIYYFYLIKMMIILFNFQIIFQTFGPNGSYHLSNQKYKSTIQFSKNFTTLK
jgi:hypothetical protein